MTVGFLYSEVMGYTEACFQKLLENHVRLIVIHWDKSLNTPYQLRINHSQITYIPSSTISEQQCIEIFNTEKVSGIYISGWMDKKYIRVARYFKKSGVKVIAGCDTAWNGSLKHYIASIIGRYWLRNSFHELLVAGAHQFEFAKRLGFEVGQISWPEYSCDVDLFSKIYVQNRNRPVEKTIVFVGRFNEVKGVRSLVEVFMKIKKENPENKWKLKLIGNGPLQDAIEGSVKDSRDILVRNFLQPEELINTLQNTGVFCLPSLNEPWGVVVHEFAVAGFPLLLSEACGSSFHFLKDGYNGYQFSMGKAESFERAIRKVMTMDDTSLKEFGEKSHELGVQINPSLWAGNLLARFQ